MLTKKQRFVNETLLVQELPVFFCGPTTPTEEQLDKMIDHFEENMILKKALEIQGRSSTSNNSLADYLKCRSHSIFNCEAKDCVEIARLRWAMQRVVTTIEGSIGKQFDKVLNGCLEIAKTALKK